MKNPDRKSVSNLEDLPNVGKATAEDLRLLDIHVPQDLCGKDPFALYEKLCERTGLRQDPCVLDVFMAVISFMEGGKALPWWDFTEERKRRWKEFRKNSGSGKC